MSRWWRAYDEAVDDPKLQQLRPDLFRAWFNICCLTSQNGGTLPALDAIAFKLRMTSIKAHKMLGELRLAGLIDDDGEGNISPHNWAVRQFKSDVTDPTAAERMKRYRKNRKSDTPNTVTVTPTRDRAESEQKTDKKPEATASGADAPRDVRRDLFDTGLKTLATITGKTPDSCRSLVGKWLKSVNDEAIHVLAAIEDAERNRVADPVAWINKTLQPRVQNGQGRPRTVQQAAADQLERFREFQEPAPALELQSAVCDGEGTFDVRLLPPR